MNCTELYGRILGALASACIGDALGAPTEERSIEEIRRIWGGRVESFHAPPDDSPFAQGRGPGQVTDDASQMLCLVDVYIEGGGTLTPQTMGRALLRWGDKPEYQRFAGPTTRKGLERLRAGEDPSCAGRRGRLTTDGTTNGAAMRVAPAGLAHPGDAKAAVHDAMITCLPTHATNLAISGAGCVAAAVATAVVPGTPLMDVVRAARWGAERGEELGREHGREVAGPSVTRRLELALELAAKAPSFDDAVADIASCIGTGLHISEAVPAALGIFLAASGNPVLAVIGGANAGGDTDTIACIVGSIAGAFSGFDAVPQDLYNQVVAANDLDLERQARDFAAVVKEHVAR